MKRLKKNLSFYFIIILLAISVFALVTLLYLKLSSEENSPTPQETLVQKGKKEERLENIRSISQTDIHNREENMNLQKEVHIPRYEIELEFNPETHILKGISNIAAWNQTEIATNQVNIQVFMNAFKEGNEPPVLPQFIDNAFPSGNKHTEMKFADVKINKQNIDYELLPSALRIKLEESWQPDQKLDIRLKWEVSIPEIHHRVGVEDDAFWFGNVLPILAVYDGEWYVYDYESVGDPFFSEISDYNIHLKTPANYDVISTGSEVESIIEEHTKTTEIEAKNVREFAFAITPNHKALTLKSKSGKEVNFFYRKADEQKVHHTLEMAVDMLDYLEEKIEEYPYEELHIFENNMFITGMEYPGLVFVQAERLKSETGYVTVLHEIAHQWFYNVVGNNQILEPWLDEGFATYLTDEFIKGDQLENFYASELQTLKARNPDLLIQNVYHYTDWSTYWRSNYRKSSLMLFDLRKRMGDQMFEEFVRTYYETYKFKIGTAIDFKELAEQFMDHDLESFFHDWGFMIRD